MIAWCSQQSDHNQKLIEANASQANVFCWNPRCTNGRNNTIQICNYV